MSEDEKRVKVEIAVNRVLKYTAYLTDKELSDLALYVWTEQHKRKKETKP